MNDLALHILIVSKGPIRLSEIIREIDPVNGAAEHRVLAQLSRMLKTGIINGEWLPGELQMLYSVPVRA